MTAEAALAAYTAACLPDRLRSAAYLGRVHFDVPGDEEELISVLNEAADSIEAGTALQSLSAAYREAHAAYIVAEAEATATLNQPEHIWAKARAAERKLFARRDALLSAALNIT